MEDKSIYNKKKTGRKTRQKGFGWYGSLNPNAGDVEKNVEFFNNAQPDGGIGAVSPVNGGPMGESVDNKPDWEGLKNYLKKYLKDEHLKWNISDIGEDAPDYGVGEDNCPEFFKILDNNEFGGTDKVNKLIDYIGSQIKNVNESFNYQMDGMVEDDFYTFERDNITYHFFFTPGRRTENKYAILAVDYGIRFDKEPYKNEKGVTVIPMSRVHDKPQQVGYFEFTPESHPEIVDSMEEEDRKEYRDLIVAEIAKQGDLKEEVEDLSWLEDLQDVISNLIWDKRRYKELYQKLQDIYYKHYPWNEEEDGPFDPSDDSWLHATSDATRDFKGMDAFWTDMKNALYSDLNEATYYTQPDGSWNRDNSAELDAERRDRESHRDASKRVKIIDPKDYNRYKTGTIGEVHTDRHGDEIYRVKLDDDVQDRYIPFKKEQLKFINNESINEGLYGYQTFIKTGERGKPIYTLTYGQSNGFIVRYNKNDYLLTFGKEWENHIKAVLEWLRIYQPNYFVKKYEDGSVSSFTPNEAEAIEYIREEIRRGMVLTEATASTKYSYTGPIYHFGNKIAAKSKLYTMAKSFKQARNNFIHKIANGDITTRYDIVDDFIKEVPKAILDTPAIEEKPEIVKCDNCGTELNPMGECPVCDYGEDDLLESIYVDSNLDALSQLNRMDEIV